MAEIEGGSEDFHRCRPVRHGAAGCWADGGRGVSSARTKERRSPAVVSLFGSNLGAEEAHGVATHSWEFETPRWSQIGEREMSVAR